MNNIKGFNQFVNENLILKLEKLIIENSKNFADQKEVTKIEIDNFKQSQEEILQKYPSLSKSDKDNITNRMNSIISDKTSNLNKSDANA